MRFQELINEHYNDLNLNDMEIAKYVLSHIKECSEFTIDDLAQACHVSKTTIMRFSQKMGLNGFSELKIILKWENKNKVSDLDKTLENVCENYTRLMKEMSERNCDDICKQIYEAKRIFVYGTGAVQNNVAREICRIFLSANKFIYCVEGGNETKTLPEFVQEGDLFILISHSGETNRIIDLAKRLKLHNGKIIAITKLKDSTLATLSDYHLYVSTMVIKTGYERGYETSTLFFILTEILFVKYLDYINSLEKNNCK